MMSLILSSGWSTSSTARAVLFDRQKLVGSIAEITIPIKQGGMGEVIVELGKTLQNYPAKASDAEHEFTKGSKVRISSVGTNVMFVESCDTTCGDKAPMTVIGEVNDGE